MSQAELFDLIYKNYCQVLEEAKQKIPDELRQLAESGGASGGRRDGGRRDEGYANRW